MNGFRKGIIESISGIVSGIVLTTIIGSLAKDGTLPQYFVWLFGLVSLILNLATINSFRNVGLLYTIGWLMGSLLFRDLLGPLDIIFNVVGPIAILILRAWFWIKNIVT